MEILAIDPGNVKSAFVGYDVLRNKILTFGMIPNEELLSILPTKARDYSSLVIEYPVPRGMPVQWQVMDTLFWIGRFVQVWGKPWEKMDRKDVKMNMCGRANAKDSNIRASIIERYAHHPDSGNGKIPEIGTKPNPGPLYGISDDVWQALGVAITWSDRNKYSNQAVLDFDLTDMLQ